MNLKIFFQGYFDNDETTSLWDELKSILFPKKGPYAPLIDKVLKAQSNYRLGVYKTFPFGDIWTIIKPFKDKISNLESLTMSLQDVLSKAKCNRQVGFILNPLRLVLYSNKLDVVNFSSVSSLMIKPGYYPFLSYQEQDYLGYLDPTKETFSHGLICGITGTGKSVMLKAFILSLAQSSDPKDNRFIIINPKNSNFGNFQDLPHVDKYVVAPEDIIKTLGGVKQLVESRLVSGEVPYKLFIFVDELSLIEDKETLTKIANVGRSLGVFLVLATQRPTADTIPTKLRSQLSYSLTGRVTNSNEARIVSGQSNSGAHLLKTSGMFIFNAPGYLNMLVQGVYIDNELASIESLKSKYPEEKQEVDSWVNAPLTITNRKDWVESLTPGKYKLVDLQRSHKEFYGKTLNANTAKGILQWLSAYWES